MLFNQHKYNKILRVGIHVGGLRSVTWNTWGLVGSFLSSQRNSSSSTILDAHRENQRYLSVLVSAPRSGFFGTFILGKESAGGSAKCIHRDLLPEDAIVTHDYLPRP